MYPYCSILHKSSQHTILRHFSCWGVSYSILHCTIHAFPSWCWASLTLSYISGFEPKTIPWAQFHVRERNAIITHDMQISLSFTCNFIFSFSLDFCTSYIHSLIYFLLAVDHLYETTDYLHHVSIDCLTLPQQSILPKSPCHTKMLLSVWLLLLWKRF